MGPPLWLSLRPTLMPQSTMEVTTVTLDITAMVDTDQDTMDTPTATAMVTTMDVILARGLLMLNLKLMPLSTMVDTMDTPVPMDMVCTTVDTMVDTMDTLDTTVMAAVTTVMEPVTTVMVDTDMDVSDTDGRFPQNLFKLFQNCIHPETKKCFLT